MCRGHHAGMVLSSYYRRTQRYPTTATPGRGQKEGERTPNRWSKKINRFSSSLKSGYIDYRDRRMRKKCTKTATWLVGVQTIYTRCCRTCSSTTPRGKKNVMAGDRVLGGKGTSRHVHVKWIWAYFGAITLNFRLFQVTAQKSQSKWTVRIVGAAGLDCKQKRNLAGNREENSK